MKFLEKMSSRMAKSASTAVKDEVRSTALDLLPTAIGIGGMVIGILMLRDKRVGGTVGGMQLPKYSTVTINNYYFGEETWKGGSVNVGNERNGAPAEAQGRNQRDRKRRR